MINDLKELKEFLKRLSTKNFIFKPYFYTKLVERPYLNEKLIIKSLKNTKHILGFQSQLVKGEKRYRIGIKLSRKYVLVVVVKIEGKNLYIITAWKTSRKWQKAIQK